MRKNFLSFGIVMALVYMLFTTTAFTNASNVHIASQNPKDPISVQARAQIQWYENPGCSSYAQVQIGSESGNGYDTCFYLYNHNDYGYLGLGDPGGPGNMSQVFQLVSPGGAWSGWIRYYGGSYPNGTFCKFSPFQDIQFHKLVYVTQIALNVSSSYHQCP